MSEAAMVNWYFAILLTGTAAPVAWFVSLPRYWKHPLLDRAALGAGIGLCFGLPMGIFGSQVLAILLRHAAP